MILPFKTRRVLLKLSGNIISGERDCIFSPENAPFVMGEIESILQEGISLAIVIGAGNILRGRDIDKLAMDRTTADHAGMLATVINGLVLYDWFGKSSIPAEIFSSFTSNPLVRRYNPLQARDEMDSGSVVILTGGTGNTHFSTDTAAVLRSVELDVDILLKGTDVEGVYDKDPDTNDDATIYDVITYKEYLTKDLRVMDLTSISLAMEFELPIVVYRFSDEGETLRILKGEKIGTTIKGVDVR